MKKRNVWVVSLLLLIGAGAIWYVDDRRQSQHEEEYMTHLANAVSYFETAEQQAVLILEGWEKRSPQDVANALLAISSALTSARIEIGSIDGYFRYHGDPDLRGSTSFFTDLVDMYKLEADSKLRETWVFTNSPDRSEDTEEYWDSLHRKIGIYKRDFARFAKVDREVFEKRDRSELRAYWLNWAEDLENEEVKEQYAGRYGDHRSTSAD